MNAGDHAVRASSSHAAPTDADGDDDNLLSRLEAMSHSFLPPPGWIDIHVVINRRRAMSLLLDKLVFLSIPAISRVRGCLGRLLQRCNASFMASTEQIIEAEFVRQEVFICVCFHCTN